MYQYADRPARRDYVEGKSVPQLMSSNLIQVNPRRTSTRSLRPPKTQDRGVQARNPKSYLDYLGNISYQNRTTNYVINAVGP